MDKVRPIITVSTDLSHECAKTSDCGMGALAFPAGKAVMDKSGFPGLFQMPDHKMVNNAVFKPGGKDLPAFGGMGNKTQRWKGAVSPSP